MSSKETAIFKIRPLSQQNDDFIVKHLCEFYTVFKKTSTRECIKGQAEFF
jgi:hypothetical protein